MIRIFCDQCRAEIEEHRDRVRRIKGDLAVEIMVRWKGAWNGGHLCDDCVIQAVTSGSPSNYRWAGES